MVHDLGRGLQRAKHGFAELSVKTSTVLGPSSCILYVEKSKPALKDSSERSSARAKEEELPTRAKKILSRESESRHITAKIVMISPFKKANRPVRVKGNQQNSPIIFIPQDAGLVGGSLPGDKKGKIETNQCHAVCGVSGLEWRMCGL